MKKKLNIIIIFLLAALFVFSAASCGGGKPNNPTEGGGGKYDPYEGIDIYSDKRYVVKNGVSNYTIVVPEERALVITNAAAELADYIERVSGAELSITTDGEFENGEGGKFISLGKTSLFAAEKFKFDYKLNGDGFYIYSKGDNAFIEAATGRGVLYGAYEFLELFAGVKFLSETYYHIPKSSDIYFQDMTITRIPDFARRSYFCALNEPDFFAKCRFLDPYDKNSEKYGYGLAEILPSGTGHTMLTTFMPYTTYGSAHPEWYANSNTDHRNALDFTNGVTDDDRIDDNVSNSAIKQMITNVKNHISTYPNAEYVMLGIEDSDTAVNNSRVRDSLARNGGKQSALQMIWVNLIAEEVESWLQATYPEREITFIVFAYKHMLEPPVDENGNPANSKVIARGNVMVEFAPLNYCYYHDYFDPDCETNAALAKYIKGWSTVTSRFCVWDYQLNFSNYLFWYPHYGSMKKNVLTYKEYGFEGLLQQAAVGGGPYYQGQLDAYLISKLTWDSRREIRDLVHDFNYYYCGNEAAAAKINEFFDLMNYHYDTLNYGEAAYHVLSYGTPDAAKHPIALLEKAASLVESAMDIIKADASLSSAQKETYLLNLTRVLVMPQWMILKNFDSYYSASLKYDFAKKFFANAEAIGIRYLFEGGSLASQKEVYGV